MSNEFQRVQAPPRDIDLADVWRAILAGKKTVIAVTLLFFLLALAYVLTATPRYSGEAKVLVENQEGYLTRQPRTDLEPDEAAVSSQVQVVLSRDLARQAIRKLNLAGNPEFDPNAGGGGLIRQIMGLITGARVSTRDERIFEEYYKRLNVFAVAKSRVVSIEFQSRDPALAARGANVIAELYIEMQAEAKRAQARAAAEALGLQVAELRKKVVEADGNVEAFRLKTGLMVGANNSTLPSQQLAEINAQLAAARTAQADSQARARLLREAVRNGRLNEVPDIANNELMRRVSEQRLSLRSQLALESRTLGPEHPRTKDLTAQIAAVEAQMRDVAERTARTLENDARIAGSRVEFLTAAVERQMRAVGGFGDNEVRLRELEREARLIKEQLEQSTQRWQEAAARQASKATPGDARIISRAVQPEKPVSPKKIMPLFAAIGGLAISIFGVVARAMIAGPPSAPGSAAPSVSRVANARSGEDDAAIAGKGVEPSLASAPASLPPAPKEVRMVPETAGARAAEPMPAVDDHEGDDIGELAERIAAAANGVDGVISLVASVDQAIASQTAMALGRKLAAVGRSVLVDVTPRPSGPRGAEGFSDVLEGRSSFGRALRGDPLSRLHVIHRGLGPVEPSENLDNALVALARTYDFVILAIAGEDDVDLALGLASFADRCVVARRAGARSSANEALIGALVESGAQAVDAVDAPADGDRRRRTRGAAA